MSELLLEIYKWGVLLGGPLAWIASIAVAGTMYSDSRKNWGTRNSQEAARLVVFAIFVVPFVMLVWPLVVVAAVGYGVFILVRVVYSIIRTAFPTEDGETTTTKDAWWA